MRIATNLLAGALAAILLGNGVWMLAGPLDWFAANPIMWRTGVPNAHLIRDVGWAYAAVAALLAAGLRVAARQRHYWGMACAWLGGHAVIHLGEAAGGLCAPADFRRRGAGGPRPATAACDAAAAAPRRKGGAPMMVAATRVAWLLLAAIHLLPALAVGLPRLQNRLYGMVPQSDLAILLGHRGVIFAAIVVTAALAGLWAPARPAAAGIVTISVLGFLLVYAWHGAPAGPLRGIAVVDLLAVPLLGLIWLDLWRA